MASRVDFRALAAEISEAARTWTQSAVFAAHNPDGIALISRHGNRSFRELHNNANRIANALLAAGMTEGDAIALMCRNRPEFVEILLGALRIGLRITPINTHLTATETAYIVNNCQAQFLLAESALLDDMVGGPLKLEIATLIRITSAENEPSTGADGLCHFIQHASSDLPKSLAAGVLMLYTSGTTGKPKGIYRDTPDFVAPQYAGSFADYDPMQDTAICSGPAYHAAPLLFDVRWPVASGVPLVLVEKWDSETILQLIATHRVTHAHWVPTMFQRLLALEPLVRNGFDISSLRLVIHGAAPCPIAAKRAMIDWLGPILIEYYAATEGGEGVFIRSQDWLQRPGSVGRLTTASGVVCDDSGSECAQGQVGRVYLNAPATGRFVYFDDPEKTATAYVNNRFTLGDMGYVDSEQFLFLTGRAVECIISGGVNIYPQEVDDCLLQHPAVEDVCTVGAPDDTWGEKVVSVVVLKPGFAADDQMRDELLTHVATRLAGFKRPRQIDFESSLPRSETGKLLRHLVRQRFWAGQSRSI
jgi:long-chain acyl-CoA synthetase